jgi:hypothetical protein
MTLNGLNLNGTNGTGRKRVLDLDALVPDRPCVRINGVDYELHMPGDFGALESVKFQRLQTELQRLGAIPEPTDEDAAAISTALTDAVRLLMVECPDEVLLTLKDGQKLMILQVFPKAAQATPPAATTPATQGENRSIGETSFPDSPGSMDPTTG